MAQSGVQSVRTVFNWATAQPEAGDPSTSPPPTAGSSSPPATTSSCSRSCSTRPTGPALLPRESGSPPEHVSDYTAYLRALVLRYGPAGSFWDEHPDLPRRPLRDWQIWNEPHLDFYWNTKGREPDAWAPEYARLLRASEAAIEAIDPGATIVLAALADFGWNHLTRLYRHGIRGHFDVAALNLFTSRPKNVLRGLALVRGSLRKGGERRKPIWLTEATWPAGKGPRPAPAGGLAARLVHDRHGDGPAPVAASTHWLRASAAASGSGASSGTRGPRPTTTATCSTTPA